MNTSLNDTVAEVYRELIIQAAENSIFRKLRRKPWGVFLRMRQYIRRMLCEYGRKSIVKRDAVSGGFNVFHPTESIFPEIKIAVYSVITGSYDKIKGPVYVDDDIDYYLVTDAPDYVASAITQTGGARLNILPVPEHLSGLSSVKKQRYIKLHPDEVLSENVTGKKYDYTIYIDGNMRITCDIKPLVYSLIDTSKSIAIHTHPSRDCIYDEAQACWIIGRAKWKDMSEQINTYKKEGMPKHFGLLETGVIIRRSNDPQLGRVMHEWWQQIERYSHRDQLSLPYVLWKNGLDMSYVFSLGRNVRRNPYFLFYQHN